MANDNSIETVLNDLVKENSSARRTPVYAAPKPAHQFPNGTQIPAGIPTAPPMPSPSSHLGDVVTSQALFLGFLTKMCDDMQLMANRTIGAEPPMPAEQAASHEVPPIRAAGGTMEMIMQNFHEMEDLCRKIQYQFNRINSL